MEEEMEGSLKNAHIRHILVVDDEEQYPTMIEEYLQQ
jgi:hypothetical protein